MHNIKNKNKSISRLNKKNVYNFPKSINNRDCLGPCYPPNTIYYHPIYFNPQVYDEVTCPIKRDVNRDIDIDRCKEEDVTNDYKDFDIFEPIVHIANTPKTFLEQIYNINIIQDVQQFLEDSIDELPIYSQKRLLECIYETYKDNSSFPKELFAEKVENVLKKMYKINLPIDKISSKLYSDKKYDNIFEYFFNKYS